MSIAKTALFPKAALLEMALGLESDAVIAERHKLTEPDIAWARGAYRAEIAKLAAEMRDSGFTFRRKNALLAEDLIQALYLKARDKDIGVSSLLEVYRTMAKYGELEPKESTLGAVGGAGGFQINIVVNGTSLTAAKNPVTVEHAAYTPPDFDSISILNPPSFLDNADLSVNDALLHIPA